MPKAQIKGNAVDRHKLIMSLECLSTCNVFLLFEYHNEIKFSYTRKVCS